jgi:hypothetical protein
VSSCIAISITPFMYTLRRCSKKTAPHHIFPKYRKNSIYYVQNVLDSVNFSIGVKKLQ